MLTNRVPAPADTTSNDRLMALLAYLLSPVVPIIILLVDSMKTRPYQAYHAMQSLGAGIVLAIIMIILSTVTLGIGACCVWILWIPMIYWAIIAYQGTGSYFEIPWLTKFMIGQGWMKPPSGGTGGGTAA